MIMDLIDKLIDRCIQLVKHKQEMDRNLLANFIDPIYSSFEEIHREYLTSFRGYRQLLKDSNQTLSLVIDRIKEDRLFNEGQRQKLYFLSNFSTDKAFGSFIDKIHEYLVNPYDFMDTPDGHHRDMLRQRWRGTLIETLQHYARPAPDIKQVKKEVENMSPSNQETYLHMYPSMVGTEEFVSTFREYIGPVDSIEELMKRIKHLSLAERKLFIIRLKCPEQSVDCYRKKQSENGIRALDILVEQMQDIYGDVTYEYLQLKTGLLTKYQ
jgi:hypothetical protein